MQHDKLEQFIQDNREALDFGAPSLKVWAKIDGALETKKTNVRQLWRMVGIAATVAFLLVAGGIIGSLLTTSKATPHGIVSLEDIDPELAKIEGYYQRQFNQKYKILTSVPHDKSIDQDIEQINASLEELHRELISAPKGAQKRIVDNLIQTYQLKVRLLERVLQRIQSEDQNIAKPKEHEKISI